MATETPLEFAPEEPTPVNPEPEAAKSTLDDEALKQRLLSYIDEAEASRKSGNHPREEVWRENIEGFWMERDYSDKLDWQAREVSPFVPNSVRRFAAAHRRALNQAQWFEVKDLSDSTGDGALGRLATKILRKGLDFTGRNATGQPIPFEKTFGDVIQTGALMTCDLACGWRDGMPAIDVVDSRDVFFDHTNRGLYRIRRIEIDKHRLLKMAEQKDSDGKPIWNKTAIQNAQTDQEFEQTENKRESSGTGQELDTTRQPMVMHEFLSVNLDNEGNADADGELMLTVLLNRRTIIRGPEPNPFWHKKDWLVHHPLISTPLPSVDGVTYVEQFIKSSQTFENMTNVLIDAIRMSSMNAFEANPEKLDNPDDLRNGIGPNHTFMLDPEYEDGTPVIRPIVLGKPLGPEPLTLWQGLKGELQEASSQSELSLGQLPQGEITATEASLSNQGQTDLTMATAKDIELGLLGPVLKLTFYNIVQHLDEDSDPEFLAQFTKNEIAMIIAKREELRKRQFSFSAKGISAIIERGQRLRGLLAALNVIGSNPLLVQAAVDEGISMGKIVSMIFEESGVDIEKIKMSPEEQARNAVKNAQGGEGGLPGGLVSPGEGTSNRNSAGGTDPLGSAGGAPVL